MSEKVTQKVMTQTNMIKFITKATEIIAVTTRITGESMIDGDITTTIRTKTESARWMPTLDS